MARTLFTVCQGVLCRVASHDSDIVVGTPDWYAWLLEATSFSFTSQTGNFTARKQQFQRGGWYWKAYRKQGGKLCCAYLGKSEHMSLERLNAIAQLLSERSDAASTSISAEPHVLVKSPHDEEDVVTPVSVEVLRHREDLSFATHTLLSLRTVPPPIFSNVIARERLTAHLTLLVERPLTMVLAQAGWGKTTLLSLWSRNCPYRVAWMTLEKSENHPIHFWTAFTLALDHVIAGSSARLLPFLHTPSSVALEDFLICLIHEMAMCSDKAVFILDDYHLITDPALHRDLLFLLEHLPSSFHLVLSSRITPPFPLARLRVRNQVSELVTNDLRFTQEEIAAFFRRVHQIDLSSESIATLESWSEGWIAGLHLSGLQAQERNGSPSFPFDTTNTHRSILTYLLEEVFEQQSATIQSFLFSTCLFDRFNESLCQAVTNSAETYALLEDVEQSLLLIPEPNGWYRYHRLLVEALQYALRRTSPERIPQLHLYASHWYEHHGFIEEAIQHALNASDVMRATALLENNAPILIERGELLTLHNWLTKLPLETIRSSPHLCLSMAWSLLLTAQIETFAFWVNAAEQAYILTQENGGTPTRMLWDEIAALRTLLLLSRKKYTYAITACEQILEHEPEENTSLRSLALLNMGIAYTERSVDKAVQTFVDASNLKVREHPLLHFMLVSSQAGLYLVQGQPVQAVSLYRQMLMDAAKPHGYPAFAEGLAHLGLGNVSWEWNDMEMATYHFLQAWSLGNQSEAVQVMAANSAFFLSQIAQTQGDSAKADEWLHWIEAFCQKAQCEELLEQAALCRVRHLLVRGHAEQALLWMRNHYQSCEQMSDERDEFAVLTYIRVLLTVGRLFHDVSALQQANLLLESLRVTVEAAGRRRSLIEILALQALVSSEQGNSQEALFTLERAITLAEPGKYIRLFVNEGEPMAKLLRPLLQQQKRRGTSGNMNGVSYLRHILKASTHSDVSSISISSAGQPLLDPLSQREYEVLSLLAAGRKNQEIAQELVVVIGTVKAHINSIYRKLAVNNRVQAVARAHTLHLL